MKILKVAVLFGVLCAVFAKGNSDASPDVQSEKEETRTQDVDESKQTCSGESCTQPGSHGDMYSEGMQDVYRKADR